MKTGKRFPEDNARISRTKDTGPEKVQKSGRKKSSALEAASLGRSATEQVRRHNVRDLANTGTNISYEGATAPGAGGSVGTGYASGKEAVDEKMRTNSDYEQNRAGRPTGRRRGTGKTDAASSPD